MVFDALPEPSDDACVLFVCTGNICRSPYAEYSLRENLRLKHASGIRVLSAGTRAVVDRGAAEDVLALLAEHGINGADFRAQALNPDMIETADLVLTASANHRSAVVQMVPRAHSRTFTIRQFARLALVAQPATSDDDSPRTRVQELVRACAAVRGVAGPSIGSADDVEDPWGGPAAGYRRMAETLRDPLRTITTALVTVGQATTLSPSHRATPSTA
ncbi:hypothetical protein [Homoserinimonas sp. OAct 916]|uniref:arsenate reductase/protein-tyrosine-phosphatase family protein n=1 Tax=Homoserinimonas sp. OAct 916 TaxID=2211450 RepID=UPI0013006E57|nr:hypothetical protein [Homoserinimonas sp. OAct 916]